MAYDKPLSYSSISLYDACPKLWARTYIEGIRDEPGAAAKRGTYIHQLLEDFFNGKAQYPSGNKVLAPWQSRIEGLVKFAPTAEGEVATLSDWTPTHFGDRMATLRGAVDLRYEEAATHILDWKTGRKYPTHVEQGELYAAMLGGGKEEVVVQFWYLDQPYHVDEWRYTSDQVDELRAKWMAKAISVRQAEEYPAVPSSKCDYCPLSWRKGGDCKRAR